MFIKQKVTIHVGSHYKGFVVVLANYQIDFEAWGSISIINKRELHFYINNHISYHVFHFWLIF